MKPVRIRLPIAISPEQGIGELTAIYSGASSTNRIPATVLEHYLQRVFKPARVDAP